MEPETAVNKKLKKNDDIQLKVRKRRKRMLWGVCILLCLTVLFVVVAWWIMIRMPGASYRGELPPSDDRLGH
jgi:hypothetical protein